MTAFPWPPTLENVVRRIEWVRAEAGRDVGRLAVLAEELERQLREAVPEDSFLADYAREILASYLLLARYGFFPEVGHGDEEL